MNDRMTPLGYRAHVCLMAQCFTFFGYCSPSWERSRGLLASDCYVTSIRSVWIFLGFFLCGKSGLHATWNHHFSGVKTPCQKWLVIKSLATCSMGKVSSPTQNRLLEWSLLTQRCGARYKDVAWLWGIGGCVLCMLGFGIQINNTCEW